VELFVIVSKTQMVGSQTEKAKLCPCMLNNGSMKCCQAQAMLIRLTIV